MFISASVFVTHGTKQVQVDGLIKWEGPFFLTKRNQSKTKQNQHSFIMKSQKGEKKEKL